MSAAGRPELGVLEWFALGERERVERVVERLTALGVRHVRTGVSWADWCRPGGADWYDWLLPRLADELTVLPCVVYTPPSLGVVPRTASPPRRPRAYADFLDTFLTRYGPLFEHVELWNEPNNLSEWDWTLDPEWWSFAEMIGAAAYWARQRGAKTVLGGMSPFDANWLSLMGDRGVLEHVDVVGVHGFPGTWELTWRGWPALVRDARAVLERHGAAADVWITEAGYSSWRSDEFRQVSEFAEVLTAPVSRVYWYAAEDLDPDRAAVDGFHTDERDYHFGLHRADGRPKLLGRLLGEGGLPAVREVSRLRTGTRSAEGYVLVTGGAGFVGSNLARRLLGDGRRVLVLDNLSRPGVEENLRWLRNVHGRRLAIEIADVRDRFALRRLVRGAHEVYHLAAQVAVTTSLGYPEDDFAVNLQGTFTLLDELRRLPEPPPLLFTSTNKVYGALPDIRLVRDRDRWEPADDEIRTRGLSERRPLDFCTPYGCSKGAADQYVLDFARSFGLRAVVFRMSCIYGPRQLGTEDQGWVAHFLRRALRRRPITIYGDGAQVRDLLYVEDLVDAMLLAQDAADLLGGVPYNMGGGPRNALSLLEVLALIAEVRGERPLVREAPERPGDQRYYVADTTRFRTATGWEPTVAVEQGLERLHDWLLEQRRGRMGAVAG
jgi:CDP-paratose 2-epimerase